MATPPKPKVFVLILHGFTMKVSAYESLVESIEKNFLDSDVVVRVPKLPLTRLSCATPYEVTEIALEEVDKFWDSLTESEQKTAKIILIGHSTGALFARKAFVVACGVTDENAPQPPMIRPWVKNVDRLILLAGINRGWTLGPKVGFFKRSYYNLGLAIGNIMLFLGFHPIIFHTRRDSKFIEDLNSQSKSIKENAVTNGFGDVLTVQLIGIQDDIVSFEDNLDMSEGEECVYLEMQYSDHFNIIDLKDKDKDEDVVSRKKLIALSLKENKENLQKLRPSNLSLPLIDVLEEEFAYLFNTNRTVEEEVALKFKDKDDLKEILANINIDKKDNKAVSAYETLRLDKLWEWCNVERSQAITFEGIENALNTKIKDHDLILNETWMEEADLRPYTRGLVINFKKLIRKRHDKRGAKRVKSNNKSTDVVRYEYALKFINRLVLEDVYGDVLVRTDEVRLKTLFSNLYQMKTNALCLSGGGIRSGTFALGVLQGMATMEFLEVEALPAENKAPTSKYIYDKITYLSTVSGGGYIGSWLSAWIDHEDPERVFSELSGKLATLQEPAPLQYVRQYSNFLSPVVGIFSADTWTLFATYLRNLVLNWLIIIPFLAALVALPWLIITILNLDVHYVFPIFGLVLGALLLGYSDFYTKKNPPYLLESTSTRAKADYRKRADQGEFLLNCVLPGSFGFYLWAISWYWLNKHEFGEILNWIPFSEQHGATHYRSMEDPTVWQYGLVAGFTAIFVLIEWLCFFFLEKYKIIPKRFELKNSTRNRIIDLLSLTFGGLCYGLLMVLLFSKIPITDSSRMNLVLYACLAFPIMLLLQLFIGFLYEGLKSNIADDPEREWRARYSGWFLIVALVWLVFSALILFVPFYLETRIEYTLSFGAITGYLTAYFGSKSVGKGEPVKAKDSGKFTKVFSYLTLPVLAFIAFLTLLVLISQLDILLISKIVSIFSVKDIANKASNIVRISPLAPFLLLGLSLGLGFIFSYFIGSNRFSLHAMYRSRLIRAFLGAARPHGVRAPDPFTGFDEADNMYMGSLAKPMPNKEKLPKKPFHIINIALNLSAGKNLAWQERKAASFTVSPLHAGSGYLGYRHTSLKGVPNAPIPEKNTNYYGGERGISLGTAMTISGAAVSPNWGYHTSTLVAFFMTLFNLRLGSWLGNPGPAGDNSFNKTSPRNAIKPILSEMFGMTDDQSEYVYLSDGGHFENLGLYEMVLRRNRFIIVSDGSCDDKCELEDLGNAIRKIRIDLGVEIDFPVGFNIGARSANLSDKGKYWAIGRIRYPENEYESIYKANANVKFRENDAVLLYIKPGIYGNEPKDIFNYASVNLAFPHESTADQFFSESQFESYRALGFYVVERIKEELRDTYEIELASLFETENWYNEVIKKLNNPKKPPTYGNDRKLPFFQRLLSNCFYTKGR